MRDQGTVRVVLVDDHDLLWRGIRTMLESEADIEVVGEGSDGQEAVGMVEETEPDVVEVVSITPT